MTRNYVTDIAVNNSLADDAKPRDMKEYGQHDQGQAPGPVCRPTPRALREEAARREREYQKHLIPSPSAMITPHRCLRHTGKVVGYGRFQDEPRTDAWTK